MSRRLPRVLLACALVAFAVGCSVRLGGGGRGTVATKVRTAWDGWTMAVDSNGVPTKAAALQAAALAFGPIPGVRAPVGTTGGSFSSSGPYRWISARWGELDEPTRTALTANLAPLFPSIGTGSAAPPSRSGDTHRSIGARVRTIGAAAGAVLTGDLATSLASAALRSGSAVQGAPQSFTDSPGTDHFRNLVDLAITRIAGRLGRPLKMKTAIWLSPKPSPDGAYAAAAHWTVGGTPYPGCWINVYPKARNASDTDLTFVFAHEVFHCFQFDVETFAQNQSLPAWVSEGQAAWVGLDAGGATELMTDAGDPTNFSHWRGWLQHPERSLVGRAYDAVGFYTVLHDTGVDVWKVLDPMLAARPGGAYAAAVAGATDAVAKEWASSHFRDASPSPPWDIHTGVGPTAKSAAPPPISTLVVANGASAQPDPADPYAARLAQLDVKADVVQLRADGYSRVADAGTLDRAPDPGAELDLCTKDGGCTCPDGSPGPATTTDATPPLRYAIGGGTTASHAVAAGFSLDDWCKKAPTTTVPAGPVDACSLLPPGEVRAAIGVDMGTVLARDVTALSSCIWKNGDASWAVQVQPTAKPLATLPPPAQAKIDCGAFGGDYYQGTGFYACPAVQGQGAGHGVFVRTRRGAVLVTTTEALSADQLQKVAGLVAHHLGT